MVETLDALLRLRIDTCADADAILFEGRATTYAGLDREAETVAAALEAMALPRASRIAYLGRNTDRFLALLFGCARAGMVLTPLNWRSTESEVRALLDDAEARMLFITREHAPISFGLVTVDVDDDTAWNDWLGEARPAAAAVVNGDDVVLQIYSSGTTGRAKGVALTHANLLASFGRALDPDLGRWSGDDRMLVVLPMFHIAALLCAGLTLAVGGCCVIMREADLSAMQHATRSHQVTKTGLVPTLIQLLIDAPNFDAAAWASLDLMIYGGSGIAPELLSRARMALDCDFLQFFGASETSATATALTPRDHREGTVAQLDSCGRALPGNVLRIVDGEGCDTAVGEPGEILVQSPSIMKGYWRLPEATAEVLTEGWYRTGDIGFLDPLGYLTIRDRVRDMIISGGENVYALEVENALAGYPAVAECAVIGTPDPLWGEIVTAVVVTQPGVPFDQDAFIAYARSRLAGYKCPRRVELAKALPKNAGGKVIKGPLRERYRR